MERDSGIPSIGWGRKVVGQCRVYQFYHNLMSVIIYYEQHDGMTFSWVAEISYCCEIIVIGTLHEIIIITFHSSSLALTIIIMLDLRMC